MMEDKDIFGSDKSKNQLKPTKRSSKAIIFIVVIIVIMIGAILYTYTN